jgi:hypothetical protein
MTRDQFLVEQEGGCWHEWEDKCLSSKVCKKCEARYNWCFEDNPNPDFSKWENMGILVELGMRNRIGIHFNPNSNTTIDQNLLILDGAVSKVMMIKDFDVIPDIIATLLAKVLGWEEE